MRIATDGNLLGIIDKSFVNKQGETVTYKEATLVVDGEVFKATVDKTADIEKEEGKGEATLDLADVNGKLKLRLFGFK